MTAGAKVTIAVVILFAVLLGVYYGFGGMARAGLDDVEPGAEPGSEAPAATAETARIDPPVVTLQERPAARIDAPRGGVLTESVSRAMEQLPPAAADVESDVLARDMIPAVPRTSPGAEPPAAAAPSPALRVGEQQPVQPLGVNQPRNAVRPAAPALPPGTESYESYTVREDDSLWTIAADFYGDAVRWPDIARANPQIDPNRLRIGQTLRMPPRERPPAELPAGRRQRDQERAGWVGSGIEYVVRHGDTLSTIAKAYLGEASQWRAVYEANRATIGGDPDRLKVGMRLRIPAR